MTESTTTRRRVLQSLAAAGVATVVGTEVLTRPASATGSSGYQLINVLDYGVSTGSSDNAAAFASAISAGMSSGLPVYVPAGTYKIASAINLSSSANVVFFGAGRGTTIINQTTSGVPCMVLGGEYCTVSDLQFLAPSSQTAAAASVLALNSTAYSCYERLILNGGAYSIGMYTGQSTNYGAFSCSFKDIRGLNVGAGFIQLQPVNSGATGSVWENIYFNQGATPVLSDVGIRFSSGCEATFKQLNVESASFSQALLYISDSSSVSIESLHIEDVHTTAQELIEVYSGGNLTINGADITFNVPSGTTSYVFYTGQYPGDNKNCDIFVDGLDLAPGVSGGFPSPTSVYVYGFGNAESNSRVVLNNVSSGDTSDDPLPAGMAYINSAANTVTNAKHPLRQMNTYVYALDGPNGQYTTFTTAAAPTSGSWNVGDRARVITPVVAGSTGSKYVIDSYVCVTAGSPGTWVQQRFLTGT